MDKPKIVVLCGSSKFVGVMAICAWLLERDEHAITMGLHLLPQWYCENVPADHLAEHEEVADQMDQLHLRKIDIAHEIFVVNFNSYIGESTKKEVEYTLNQKKKVRWFTHDRIGKRVIDIIKAQNKDNIKQAFEIIREEAVDRMKPGSDYPGKLCEVSIEVDRLLLMEMGEFREAEREAKYGIRGSIENTVG